jgi:cytochrome c oxidase cbb3-type subunit III
MAAFHSMKSLCRATICSLTFLVFSPVMGAQEPQSPPPKEGQVGEQGGPDTIGGGVQDPAAVERGRELFAPTCGFCHGADARGRSGPDLVRSNIVLHDVKGNLIGPVVRNGRPLQGMPAFSLSSDQISDIAAFLHSKTHGAANRFTYVISGLVTGDAKAGEAFFNGAGKCNACHSPQQDLAHIASKYDPVELQSRLLSPPSPDYTELSTAKTTPRAAVEVTVKLPQEESVSGTLVDLDSFDISLIDSRGWFHSYPRAHVQLEIRDPLQAHREMLPNYTDKDMHNLLAYLETLK